MRLRLLWSGARLRLSISNSSGMAVISLLFLPSKHCEGDAAATRILDPFKGTEACGEALRVVGFIGISGHPDSVKPLDAAAQIYMLLGIDFLPSVGTLGAVPRFPPGFYVGKLGDGISYSIPFHSLRVRSEVQLFSSDLAKLKAEARA